MGVNATESNSTLKSLDTFSLPDQKIQSAIEKEFIKLFSPSNMTASANLTSLPLVSYKSLNFANDL